VRTFIFILMVLQIGGKAGMGGKAGSGGGGVVAGLAFINGKQQNQVGNPTNTFTYTCAAGNLLIVAADTITAAGTITLTVSGNTVVPVTGQTNITTATGSGDVTASSGYVTSCSGGLVTITATTSAGGFGNLFVSEYQKGGLAGVLDNAGTPCLGATGGNWNACSATSTAAGELMVNFIFANNAVSTWPTVAGFNTRDILVGSTVDISYDKLATTIGTNTLPSTFNSLNNNTIVFSLTVK
jgi:hypothetical protein